ncbi:hypothetical protein GCM10009589_08580 [Arthrobacter pascens]
MAAEERTNDAADLDVTNVATSVPSASASCTVVPAGSVEPKVSCTPDCVELVPGGDRHAGAARGGQGPGAECQLAVDIQCAVAVVRWPVDHHRAAGDRGLAVTWYEPPPAERVRARPAARMARRVGVGLRGEVFWKVMPHF